MKFAMVFPGQGSQSVGMLQGYGESAEVQEVLAVASEALKQDIGKLIAEGPAEELNRTVNTQPVMLTAGFAAYRLWRALGGPEPDIVAGHSLGEYTALVAAGALDFADALPLVRFRAQAMQEAVPQGEGAMAAILGLDDDTVRAACAEAAEGQVVEPVNYNAPSQVVIAGHAAAVERAMAAAKARGAKRTVRLPVSGTSRSAMATISLPIRFICQMPMPDTTARPARHSPTTPKTLAPTLKPPPDGFAVFGLPADFAEAGLLCAGGVTLPFGIAAVSVLLADIMKAPRSDRRYAEPLDQAPQSRTYRAVQNFSGKVCLNA